MPSNLEIKIQLPSFKRIKNILKKNNADFVKILKQKDVYYKVEGMFLKLRIENGENFLIKYIRNEKKKHRFSNYKILEIKSLNAEKYFKNIFVQEAIVDKKRLLYLYDNTRIHLDEVKNLGKFLELETLVIKGREDAKKRFNKMINMLQLNLIEQIKSSYRDLILSNKK